MIEKLIAFFKKPKDQTKGNTPEGLCPNCWGNQEYDDMIREMYKDKQIEVNNHSANYAFIQDFVVNKINFFGQFKIFSRYIPGIMCV